jgi:hypothetical protein
VLQCRDRALVALYDRVGLRLAQIVLPGPRTRKRVAAVPDPVLYLLEAYQDTWPEEPEPDEPLLLSSQERTDRPEPAPWRWHPRRLSVRQARRVLAERGAGCQSRQAPSVEFLPARK